MKHSSKQDVLIKLTGILVKSMRAFKNKFSSAELEQVYKVKFTEQDLDDVLRYKNHQIDQFKGDKVMCKRIQRSVEKLLACMLECPAPFVNSSELDIVMAANLILKRQVDEIGRVNGASDLDQGVNKIANLDLLTACASHSVEVYKLLQKVEVTAGQTKDLIGAIIAQLLGAERESKEDEVVHEGAAKDGVDSPAKESKREAGDPEDSTVITVAPEDREIEDEHDVKTQQLRNLVHYLYKLSLNPLFFSEYGKTLPTDLYERTIKSRSTH